MHGIGGHSIEQAKHTLTLAEVRVWQAYRARRGSLNAGLMTEAAVARLSAMYANTHSKHGNHEPADFMPHFDVPDLTLEEAMAAWG